MDKMEVHAYLRRVKDHLAYNPEDGIFTWKVHRQAAKVGGMAGSKDKDGYVVIYYNGKNFKAHRLAWYFCFNEMPSDTIDHINRIRDDNRIENLRVVTQIEQMQNMGMNKNNTSGYTGVYWYADRSKWLAQVRYKGAVHHVGFFDDAATAYARRKELKESLVKSQAKSRGKSTPLI